MMHTFPRPPDPGFNTEKLAARLSVSGNYSGGYVRNRLRGGGDNLNNTDDQAARLQLLFTPNENLDILLSVRDSRQSINTGFFENVSSIRTGELTPSEFNPVLGYLDNDGNPFAGDYEAPGHNQLETFGSTVTVSSNMIYPSIGMLPPASTGSMMTRSTTTIPMRWILSTAPKNVMVTGIFWHRSALFRAPVMTASGLPVWR